MRGVVPFLASLFIGLICLGPSPAAAAASSSSFSFNWTAQPASPQPWVPGPVNDWDLIANIAGPTDNNGAMEAGHGPDCGPPPATHHIVTLTDSVYLCKGHMMTAIYGGGDAFVEYGAVYFTPAHLVDWSQGRATLSWKVSTKRNSTRDWWQVNLTPFSQNLVFPLNKDLPTYQGEPNDGMQIKLDGGGCGSIVRVETIVAGDLSTINTDFPCVEDFFPQSATVRTQFQVELSANHLKVYMPGSNAAWYDGPINLPFNQAVVQFSHHSYDPLKGENFQPGAPPAPNTFHWSDVSISPATPFTMLRPQQPTSLHDGRNPILSLPQPAPQNAFLRFAGLGNFQVSFDGGRSFQPARLQGRILKDEHFASYWTPIPAGTTQVAIRGQENSSGLSWWAEDVSVWASDAPSSVSAPPPTQQAPPPQQPPAATVPVTTPAQSGSSATGVTRPPKTGAGVLTVIGHRLAGLGWAGVILAAGIGGLVVTAGSITLWRRRRSLRSETKT